MDKIKLILVDDHQVVIDGIAASLMLYDDIEVIAEASNGKELFEKLETFSPDIIILDITMPDITGIEVCKMLKRDFPEIKVIFFTGNENQDSIFEALKAGANAFLPKETQREELVSTIYAVNKGENYISNSISNTLIIDYLKKEKKTSKYSKKEIVLTEREIEILTHIAEGLPYKNIAAKLFISTKTVEKHKRNLLNKLNLESTVDLVKYAIKNNIIDF